MHRSSAIILKTITHAHTHTHTLAHTHSRSHRDHYTLPHTASNIRGKTEIDTQGAGKALILDPYISGPLGRVIEMSLLKDHGVQRTLTLQEGALNIEQTKIVYIVRANITNMYTIAEHIRGLPPGRHYNIHLCQVPRRAAFCERVLEEEGVCDDMSFSALDLGFFPIEKDVLSMESTEAFRMTKMIGDKTHLFDLAKSLMTLQILTGIIGEIKGKGSDAKVVAEMMIKLRAEVGMHDECLQCEHVINTLVLVDRDSDMVSPMLTQVPCV